MAKSYSYNVKVTQPTDGNVIRVAVETERDPIIGPSVVVLTVGGESVRLDRHEVDGLYEALSDAKGVLWLVPNWD